MQKKTSIKNVDGSPQFKNISYNRGENACSLVSDSSDSEL